MRERTIVGVLAAWAVAVGGIVWFTRAPPTAARAATCFAAPDEARAAHVTELASPRAPDELRASAAPVVAIVSAAPDPAPIVNASSGEFDRAVRQLSAALASPAFHWRSFEEEGRSLAGQLSPAALAALGNGGFANERELVARAALLRFSSLPLAERKALGRQLVAGLRTRMQDTETPLLEAREAAAALACLGDDADRARLVDDICSATAPRAREIARAGLSRAGGNLAEAPAAATELVQRAREKADAAALREALCIATGWLHEGGELLPPREREDCAVLLQALATDARNVEAQARALTALAVVDKARAAHVAIDWFADAERNPADAAVAGAVLREARLDSSTTAALFEKLGDERRAIFAEALLANPAADQDERTLAVAREFARAAAGASTSAVARRRAVSALASSTDARDRELVAQLAQSDTDESVRETAARAVRDADSRLSAAARVEPR